MAPWPGQVEMGHGSNSAMHKGKREGVLVPKGFQREGKREVEWPWQMRGKREGDERTKKREGESVPPS
jgi:hypothetical protein